MKPVVQHALCRWPVALLVLALALGAAAPVASAEDLQLEATLIQGANDGPVTVNHILADETLSAGLRRNFPWTNYYEKNGGNTWGPIKVGTGNFNNINGTSYSGGNGNNINLTGYRWPSGALVNHGSMPAYVSQYMDALGTILKYKSQSGN